jgi:hypothetical protein
MNPTYVYAHTKTSALCWNRTPSQVRGQDYNMIGFLHVLTIHATYA